MIIPIARMQPVDLRTSPEGVFYLAAEHVTGRIKIVATSEGERFVAHLSGDYRFHFGAIADVIHEMPGLWFPDAQLLVDVTSCYDPAGFDVKAGDLKVSDTGVSLLVGRPTLAGGGLAELPLWGTATEHVADDEWIPNRDAVPGSAVGFRKWSIAVPGDEMPVDLYSRETGAFNPRL